jgi:hypothetical protein
MTKRASYERQWRATTYPWTAPNAAFEANHLVDLVRQGAVTIEEARKLIAITAGEVATLRKLFDWQHVRDAIAQRAAVRVAFDHLVSAKVRERPAVDPNRQAAKKSKSRVLNTGTAKSREKWAD